MLLFISRRKHFLPLSIIPIKGEKRDNCLLCEKHSSNIHEQLAQLVGDESIGMVAMMLENVDGHANTQLP